MELGFETFGVVCGLLLFLGGGLGVAQRSRQPSTSRLHRSGCGAPLVCALWQSNGLAGNTLVVPT